MKRIFTLVLLMTGIFTSPSFANPVFSTYISFNTLPAVASPMSVNNVILKDFLASTDGKLARLTWTLERVEYQLTCFLERSDDGVNFTAIKQYDVEIGFSGSLTYIDQDLNSGAYYYRLNLVKEGLLPYTSYIVTVKLAKLENAEQQYHIMNPFSHQLTISGDFIKAKKVLIELMDMSGQRRVIKEMNIPSHNVTISIPTNTVSKGMYILRIRELGSASPAAIMSKCVYKSI